MSSPPTLACLVTAHGFAGAPNGIIYHLNEQTRPPDAAYLAMSDVPNCWLAPVRFPVSVSLHPNKEDYGYDKRNRVLPTVQEEFVTFVCHDDTYHLDYFRSALEVLTQGYDVVYCAWNDIPNCIFQGCSSTLGNFIVRTELAKKIGFPRRDSSLGAFGESDAALIDALVASGAKVRRLNRVMYYHNVPRFSHAISRWGRQEPPTMDYVTIKRNER